VVEVIVDMVWAGQEAEGVEAILSLEMEQMEQQTRAVAVEAEVAVDTIQVEREGQVSSSFRIL